MLAELEAIFYDFLLFGFELNEVFLHEVFAEYFGLGLLALGIGEEEVFGDEDVCGFDVAGEEEVGELDYEVGQGT